MPQPHNAHKQGEDVCLSLSAITFLRNNKMNFDDWLTRGVTYLNAAGEESLKKRLDQERERDKERAEAGPLDPGQRMKLNRWVVVVSTVD